MGPFAPNVNRTIDNLALLYEAQGNYDEARKFYERAISNWSTSLGSSPQEATGRENYAEMLRKIGRDAEAATMEARAKAMRARHSTPSPVNLPLTQSVVPGAGPPWAGSG